MSVRMVRHIVTENVQRELWKERRHHITGENGS